MASIRFKFRASTVSGKQGTLFIQVIHRRVARQVSTQYKLYPGEWGPRRAVGDSPEGHASRPQPLPPCRAGGVAAGCLPPTAHHHTSRRGRDKAIPEQDSPHQPLSEEIRRRVRTFLQAHLLRGTPLLGQHRQESGCPPGRHQRSHGAFHPTHHIHLPQVLREYPC